MATESTNEKGKVMYRLNPKRLTFRHWAMQVHHRGWAATSVVLHRLQRMTVSWGGAAHRQVRRWECEAFDRAVTP